MRKKYILKLLVSVLALSSITACTNNEVVVEPKPESDPKPVVDPQLDKDKQDESIEISLDTKQKNSIAMLNYLAILSEEIKLAKNNRILLDELYDSLINNINPSKIDESTQEHIHSLLISIEGYKSVETKRDRLQYIYNQDKAMNIKNAVPNPLAMLSVANALDWKRLAATVSLAVVDSFVNYKSAESELDKEFLISGWELDDEETKLFDNQRRRTFDYMIDITREYELPGKNTLSEESIKNYAKYCETETGASKTTHLEMSKNTYELYTGYWLELAKCYYDSGQYKKCLDCIEAYNELYTDIFRKDFDYCSFLPQAIVAAQNVYSGNEYITKIDQYTNDIVSNSNLDDWALRYFAASSYLDLYNKTEDKKYLEKAYELLLNNINHLADEQKEINKTYINELEEIELESIDYDYMTKDEKKKIKKEQKEEQKKLDKLNKSLEEKRKTELPSLYEPLILNCELFFPLLDMIDLSASDKLNIKQILGSGANEVFITKQVNNQYSLDSSLITTNINLDLKNIIIPITLLCEGSKVSISIKKGNKITDINDLEVKKVNREDGNINNFKAYYSSKKLSSYEWDNGDIVTIKISSGDDYKDLTYKFELKNYKDNFIISDKYEFVKYEK